MDDTGFDEQIVPMHIMTGVGDQHGSIRPDLPVRHQARQYVEEVGSGETKCQECDLDITRRVCDFLRHRATEMTERPWVLFVSMICPDFPLIAPRRFHNMHPLDALPDFKPLGADLFGNYPWRKGFNDCFIHERFIRGGDHRKRIPASYLGLCSLMNENVGRILATLDDPGMSDDTRVVNPSDYSDNIGALRI